MPRRAKYMTSINLFVQVLFDIVLYFVLLKLFYMPLYMTIVWEMCPSVLRYAETSQVYDQYQSVCTDNKRRHTDRAASRFLLFTQRRVNGVFLNQPAAAKCNCARLHWCREPSFYRGRAPSNSWIRRRVVACCLDDGAGRRRQWNKVHLPHFATWGQRIDRFDGLSQRICKLIHELCGYLTETLIGKITDLW